ncbi:MAG: glycosyltransferase [Calditrichaceae bacterium]|nr:glycosyltransferase [Calditrichaceae bacterium]MBN2707698.1 glycosyltransferase [Calditrichaceae bacterium]RQV96486.1 MAG: glycosyltransferase [Calditrichota bacterium]
MNWLLYAFLLFSALYTLIIILVMIGLLRLKKGSSARQPKISIVVAAKNEEKRIYPLLESLAKIDYPKDNYEVIIVDDASTDHTFRVASVFAADKSNWKILKMEKASDRYHAKKMALAKGIEHSAGEIVLVTDADCRVHPHWLKAMAAHFDEQTIMVLGYASLEKSYGRLQKFLDFDNLFSAIFTASTAMLGFPLSSVGRNMAFRRSAYDQIGGYASLTKFRSGDDIHLTERMRDHCRGKITFCADPYSFVHSQPPDTYKEIFYQQIRKNSKIMDKSLKSSSFSVFLFIALMLYIFLPVINPAWLTVWLTMLALKLGVEFIALLISVHIFRLKKLIPILPLMQVFYPVYVTLFGIAGWLHLYKWK